MRSDLLLDVLVIAAVAVAAAVFFLRRCSRGVSTVVEGEGKESPMADDVAVVFSFHRRLLKARDAETVIHIALQAAGRYVQAEGCSFVPFDEWRPSLPALVQGKVPESALGEWSDRLSKPEVRQACKLCRRYHAGGECVLLEGTRNHVTVFCAPLRFQGREMGMMNFYDARRVGDDACCFLDEMARSVELALEAVRLRRQERLLLRVSGDGESDSVPSQDSLSDQIAFRAVLDERARLAREIHDGLAQTLAFLKLEAARMREYLARGQQERLERTLEGCYRTLSDAYLDARQAIEDLRRVPLADLGDWLRQEAEDFAALAGVDVRVRVDVKRELSSFVQAQLMRIVQEALTNVRKHAHADEVVIAAWETEDAVLVEVRDDGVGFSPRVALESHHGLRGMRERAGEIGAVFQVVSREGDGTTVRLRIPFAREC